MRLRSLLFIFPFLFICSNAHAQVVSFKDTIAAYNAHRLRVNKTGMKILGGWGIANITVGGVGYFAAQQDEWKYFHAMNAAWGVVNTGIAALSLRGIKKEGKASMNAEQSFARYQSNKRLYLINAGFDVLYIAAGVGITAIGNNAKSDADIYKGFGRSFVVQGVFLLLFDNAMYAAHQRGNSHWLRLMNEIHISGYGVSWVHPF